MGFYNEGNDQMEKNFPDETVKVMVKKSRNRE